MREKLIELWEENLEGRGIPAVAVVVAGIAAALYYFDYLGELATGATMAAAMVVACVAIMLTAALGGRGGSRVAALALTLLTAGASAVPIVATLRPGERVAHGSVRESGDKLTLPPEATGRVRLLIHGTVAGSGDVDYMLRGTTEPVKGKLARTTSTARAGRGARTTVTQERTSEFVAASVPDGTTELVLANVNGQLAGPIDIQIFRDWWPVAFDLPLVLLLLAALVVVAARGKTDSAFLSAGPVSLFFGVFVYEFASPERAVRAEIGAVILALLVGGSIGGLLAWIVKKLGPQTARKTP